MPGVFVTGTDTGVGKTILSASLAAALVRAGERVHAHKPVLTGLDEETSLWPADHELLGAAAQMPPQDVAPLRFGPPVAPHLAARLAGAPPPGPRVLESAAAAMESARRRDAAVIVEGV
ncbi:MAG: ATP-dependent dethiobiotin synthetase BioD, partial [Solirubrobacteraceae bacterium]